jgi:PP-loop superfamily ATP-utilizing enzyme
MKFTWEHINRFNIDIDETVEQNLKSFKEEMIDFVESVTHKKDVILLFSGGNDSRLLARTLMELGTPFKAITTCFKSDFTDYDSIVSQQFCLSNKIEQYFLSK